ncbi:MAG: glycosyltransferase [Oligoflexales bacterium]
MKIVIATPSFNIYDAIAADVSAQRDLFLQKGHECVVFSELGQPPGQTVGYAQLRALVDEPQNLLIYHHSIHWPFGHKLLEKARCKIIIRYHNITPSEYFMPFDSGAWIATKKGMEQTKDIISLGRSKNVLYYLGNSTFSCEELTNLGAPRERTVAIPPFNNLRELVKSKSEASLESLLRNGPPAIIFVGRLVPHKNHTDLMRVIRRYCEVYDSQIKLYLIGALRSLSRGYADSLQHQVHEMGLGENVSFTDSVSLQQLRAYYSGSKALLVLSKHEGFCVPIAEAQSLGLPVVAVEAAAVGETMGPDQLLYPGFDVDILSAALRKTIYDNNIRQFLIEAGLKNSKKFFNDVISKHYTELDLGDSKAR